MKISFLHICLVFLSVGLSNCDGEIGGGESGIVDNAGTVDRVDPRVDALVPIGANIQKLAGGFAFTEGPVWDQRNNQLYFSDLRSNAIHTWNDEAGLGTYLQPVFEGDAGHPSVGSNGLNMDSQGRLLLMEHGNRVVSRIESDGSRTVLVDQYRGMRLNSPNDSAWHSNGWLYFTDPPYGLAQQESDPARELEYNGIYRLSPEGEIQLLESDQTRPNGIAFSPDQQTLYVANSDGAEKVWYAYDVMNDGSISNPRIFYDVNDQDTVLSLIHI